VLPDRCALGQPGEECRVFEDHRRFRKTGPCFPVAVIGCLVHPAHRYTVYPPGHFPYGRKAVVACSVSGPSLLDASTGEPPWEATVFAAALDASAGRRWLRSVPGFDRPPLDDRRRRTQGRHLEWTGRLVGVHPDLDEDERLRIAARLGVPGMAVLGAARSWSRSWTARGVAITAVLLAVPVDALLLDRLLQAGEVARLWARPRRWDPGWSTWVLPRSAAAERLDLAEPRGRSPPPTNSRRDRGRGDGAGSRP
jgi:hypothetical protein